MLRGESHATEVLERRLNRTARRERWRPGRARASSGSNQCVAHDLHSALSWELDQSFPGETFALGEAVSGFFTGHDHVLWSLDGIQPPVAVVPPQAQGRLVDEHVSVLGPALRRQPAIE